MTGMEKIVKGATKIKLAAPKSKYIEPILSATQSGESGVADVFQTLQLRLRDSTWTIVFKSLVVVHLMIREGRSEVTLKYLSEAPKRLAINQFTEAQTQGQSIRRYYEYLVERVRAYADTKTDFVKSGAGKMKSLTVDKGLLRQTESIQNQIRTLLRCDLLGSGDPDNEISLTAFRLLTMDLLELFKAMNEGTINVLEHYFEMSRVDAERSLNVYKTFGRQTDQVVQYLSLARQYQNYTRLEVPKLKHAPTTLTSSLEDYLNDPDFEINRRQYLAQQEAKRTGKPVARVEPPKPVEAVQNKASAAKPVASQPPKGPAPDLIDFFESIEQNQQTMVQQPYAPQQQFNPAFAQQQVFQQQQIPQQTGYNPFLQNYATQPQMQSQQQLMQQQTQGLQPDFTGAGFGGYGPQPQQNHFSQHQFTQLSPIPQDGVVDFQQQQQPQQQNFVQQVQSPQSLQPQTTGTNPFRQSMIPTGSPNFGGSPGLTRQPTNPFAKHANSNNLQSPQQQVSPPNFANNSTPQDISPQPFSPQALQPQATGTNPFAKNRSPPPQAPLSVNVTGSTNPFRQSQFVNQQTGQGWQHSNQGMLGGYDINNVETVSIFPRPGATN